MPTTLNFGKLLGKSPFKPMIRHMKIATECAGHIPEAVTAFFDNDKNRLKEIKQAVSQLESDADKIFEQLQHRLSKSLFLPVERRDLLDVIEMQEAIADRTEDIVGLMVDLPMDVPEELHSPIHMLTDRAVDAVKVAGDIIGKFDELLETGFKGPEVRKTRELIRQVIEIETDADHIGTEITHNLFKHATDMDAVAMVFLHRLISWIDDLADYAEKLAIRARLMVAADSED